MYAGDCREVTRNESLDIAEAFDRLERRLQLDKEIPPGSYRKLVTYNGIPGVTKITNKELYDQREILDRNLYSPKKRNE